MKKSLVLIMIVILTASLASAQELIIPNKPYSVLNSEPGFITINELTAGFGLGNTSVPFSKSFFGFNTVNGYQINKNFVAAVGTGLSFYNGGMLVPLYLDFRYRFKIALLTPYLFGDGGLLFNFSDFNETMLFINPGAGARYTFSRSLAASLGVGFLVQMGPARRDTFINIKGGVTYKF